MDRLLYAIENEYSDILNKELNQFIKDNFNLEECQINTLSKSTINIFANDKEINFDIKIPVYAKRINVPEPEKIFKNSAIKNCYIYCKIEITNTIKNFKVLSTSDEPHNRCELNNAIQYNSNLVPNNKRYPMQSDAEDLLKKYYTSDEITNFRAIPIRDLASRMGLIIEERYKIDNTFSAQGTTIMYDDSIELYDITDNKRKTVKVSEGTILIDAEFKRKNNEKRINFVIAHEIYHWLRHKNFIKLRKIVGECQGFYHVCMARTPYFWKDDNQRVEVQANNFAQSLLLCHKDLIVKYDNLLWKNEFYMLDKKEEVMDKVLKELANHYNVSIMTLVLHLTADGRYDKFFDKYTYDFDNKNSHYEIKIDEFTNLCENDDRFYELIRSKKFIFKNGRVFINDGKSKDFAKCNTKEKEKYCIDFKFDYSGTTQLLAFALNSNQYKRTASFDYNKNEKVIERANTLCKDAENMDELFTGKFSDTLKNIRKYRKKTQSDMAEYLKLSLRNYQKYEETDSKPKVSRALTIVRILSIPPDYGMKLFRMVVPEENNDRNKAYKVLINCLYNQSSTVWNKYLKEKHMEDLILTNDAEDE